MIQRKSWINRVSHTLKVYLGTHISKEYLKLYAFLISLVSCISAGSILLFSLYSVSLHENIGLSYFDINLIASLSAVGMYFCLPILGYLADIYGPSLLSLLSIWFFIPSYFASAKIVAADTSDIKTKLPSSFYLYSLGTCFFFIGLATSSLYFSSLLTCAKIYPNFKGLAISLPVSCYGLSSLLLSQLIKLPYFLTNSSLNLVKVFTFFAYLYLFVGVFNFLAASIVSIESEVIFANSESQDLLCEQTDEELGLTDNESDTFLPHREIIEPSNHSDRYKKFLRDPSAWLLLLSLITNLGPLESFQNNLASISRFLEGTSVDPSMQVSLLAASSTITRLIIGILSDFVSSDSRKYPICRVWILIAITLLGCIAQYPTSKKTLSTMSILSGSTYGGLFTIYPTIVASIWGIDIMGSTWGSFMVAPAIGSVSYSLLYGKQSDSKCIKEHQDFCLHDYFAFTSGSLMISSIIIIIVWRFIWWKRGFTIF